VEDASSDADFLRDVINDAIRALRRLENRAHQQQKNEGIGSTAWWLTDTTALPQG
jgi:hypothetical protein